METWQSDTSDAGDGDVIEIIPVDEYDVKKAKVKASLSWILYKAYRDNVPKDFLDPFYQTGEGVWHVKPRLANALANSEVYCLACRYMFGETASQWTGHWSIIQVLSRKGIYAVGSDSVDVTETILMQSAPFRIKAHIALIDALMVAFAREIMSVERVTQSVRRFASFNASSELPTELEDTVMFWVNKVCVSVQRQLDKAQATSVLEGGETNQKVRIVSSKTPRDSISVPIVENLLEDVSDGCSLATLVSFYCPQILDVNDVCLKSNVGIADSLYNLRLVKSFCQRHLPDKTCHFTFEDLLYCHQSIRENMLMMIAEVYYWFEIKTLPIVTGAGLSKGDGDRPSTAANLQSGSASKLPSIPISNVTKQSFQRMKGDAELRASAHSPSSQVPPRMPLLHRRQQQGHVGFHDDHGIKDGPAGVHRTHSLTSHDTQRVHVPRQSVVAWQEGSQAGPGVAQTNTDRIDRSGYLLGNVSMDSDMNASFSSGSIDLGELEPTPRADTHRSDGDTHRSEFDTSEDQGAQTIHFSLQNKQGTPHPGRLQQARPVHESMELESVNSGQVSRVSGVSGYNDGMDLSARGDNVEPLLPARLKPAKEKSNMHSKEEEKHEVPKRKTPSPPKLKKRVEIDPHLEMINRSMASDVSVTPVPHEQVSQDYGTQEPDAELLGKSPKRFDAFFVRGSVSDSQDTGQLSHRSDVTVAESYIVDQSRTPEAAMAAGIPVIEDSFNNYPGQRLSREGSIASSKSSGDFSDHESHKIHHDHKTKESYKSENRLKTNTDQDLSDPARFIFQKPIIVNRQPKDSSDKAVKFGGTATNFAQIKQMKQFGTVDNSGLVYMQHGKEEEEKKSPLKEAFQKNKVEKKTTFAPLPNQTSWQQAATNQNGASGSAADNGPVSQEMQRIKMKLEEKRKAIERKKHTQEIQQQKMRQRLGKAAFLHVVAKPKDESGSRGSGDDPPSRMTTSDPDVITGSSASTPDSRMSMSSSSPLKSPPQHPQQFPRSFCRDDIQQTIENVRKKWFNNDDVVAQTEGDSVAEESQSRSFHEQNRNVPCEIEDNTGRDERNSVSPVVRRPVFDRRSASIERINSLASSLNDVSSQERMSSPSHSRSGQGGYERRSVSVERQPQGRMDMSTGNGGLNQGGYYRRSASIERSRSDRPFEDTTPPRRGSSQNGKIETNDQFNSSLDQLNQNLSDLQEEIKQLSLKKKEAELTRNSAHAVARTIQPDDHSRSRSQSPPKDLDVRNKTQPRDPMVESASAALDGPRASQDQGQGRSSSEPRQLVPEQQQPADGYQSHTLPRQQSAAHAQVQNQIQQVPPQYMLQQNVATVARPAGPIYPGQFVPPQMATQTGMPPTPQQYGSYLMGPGPQQTMVTIPQQQMPTGYQQSPPHVYPSSMGMYAGHQFPNQQLVSPMYPSPPHSQFQPGHIAGTYTTSVLQQQPFPSPVSQPMSFIPTTQPVYPQQHHQQLQQHQLQQQDLTPSIPSSQQQQAYSMVDSRKDNQDPNNTVPVSAVSDDADVSAGGGFFVAMSENESPRRLKSKPQLSARRTKPGDAQNQSIDSDNEFNSSVIADFAKKVTEQEERSKQPADGSKSADVTMATKPDEVTSAQPEVQPVGFLIGQDETTIDQTAEIEMQKKKEKLERMRLKRQEEQEKKRQRQEQELNRKREQERLRQEEAERRKIEEKARRELIFKQYLEKKEEEEEQPPKREKPRQKPRPKSMFVKAAPGGDTVEGPEGFSSTEDVSRNMSGSGNSSSSALKGHRKLIIPSKKQSMRKAVSCNVLNGSGTNGDKNLAFGGLTHRRPPSPDLYGRGRRGLKSSEGSESSSGHGSEYSGPKLFVKPSAKSNRHIITNAISHCCLAGCVNSELKNKVLEEIARSSAKHFIILFRDAGCGYRGLYGFDPDSEDCTKIMGVGPRCIHNTMVEKYFKYNSGGKTFSEVVSTKHLSVSIDAIVMNNALWKQTAKAPSKGR